MFVFMGQTSQQTTCPAKHCTACLQAMQPEDRSQQHLAHVTQVHLHDSRHPLVSIGCGITLCHCHLSIPDLHADPSPRTHT